jgi:UDP-N-acetylglucosamine--N-acetylmuramyl-(pentapeptide) pyrophosphoryl-undecaprenol N-acetylglucosamine transferase
MLAAGGTGGHLFPAQALAEELNLRGIAVELATDTRGDRYGAGFPARAVHQIASATITAKSPVAMAKTGITLTRGIAAAYQMMGHSRPAVVVGYGGYPSFPPLLAARMRGIPTMLHEQNAVLGRANRMLARRVTAIATSFPVAMVLAGEQAAKGHFTGNPVRGAVLAVASVPYVASLAGEPLKVLVFGGSQGARFFSDSVPPALALLSPELRARLVITQQAPFFTDLPARMAASHLVIGRAGGSSVAELAVIGRPSILVPLPHAVDNDQLRNATSLSAAGGAWLIEQSALSPERLAAEITQLANDPQKLAAAAAAAKSIGRPDAAQRLADLVVELMRRNEATP